MNIEGAETKDLLINIPLSKHAMPAAVAGIQVSWMRKAISHP
ncbi:hypothetical protein [Methylomonas lenta]|nr:hypothetical protein [Methylomonas lenta]